METTKRMNRLWEERVRGEGDLELEVNGDTTNAHWCILKDVPYFQMLKRQQAPDNEKPSYLKIVDNSISLQSIVATMKYTYSDYCFTSKFNPAEFHSFCQFVKVQSLALNSFNLAIQCINQFNCVDYFNLGRVYQLAPLKRRAWRKAIDNQWLPQIKQMLDSQFDLDAPLTNELQTALHISLDRGYLAVAQVLIAAGAKVNTWDYKGTTPLGLAVWDGHSKVSELLLNSGALIDSTDQWGQTALHKACGKGLTDIVCLLLKHGANTNITSRDGYTPLHMAAIGGLCHYVLRTSVIEDLPKGHEKVVLTLLEHGAVWEKGDMQWQATALHMAAMKGQTHLVKLLLELDRNEIKEDNDRERLTSLHTAVKFGYCDVVRTLIEHGASANAKDWEGRTPLHYAARAGNTEALEILLRARAGLYKQDIYKMTCLHVAVKSNNSNAVSLLLQQKNCPLNVVDKYGLTALHYAAENRNTNMVRQLLRAGAVPTILSNDGEIARNLRGKKKHLDTLKFLIMARS